MSSCKIKLCIFTFIASSFKAWAMPCEQFTPSQLAGLTVEEQKTFATSCAVVSDEASIEPRQSIDVRHAWDQGKSSGNDFWDDWSGDNHSPVLTSKSKSKFYGLGFWIPSKYDDPDFQSVNDAEEWIKKHGLQMSFGVGGEDGRSTRVRVDYRWHDESLDDISLQIEIPFQ